MEQEYLIRTISAMWAIRAVDVFEHALNPFVFRLRTYTFLVIFRNRTNYVSDGVGTVHFASLKDFGRRTDTVQNSENFIYARSITSV